MISKHYNIWLNVTNQDERESYLILCNVTLENVIASSLKINFTFDL